MRSARSKLRHGDWQFMNRKEIARSVFCVALLTVCGVLGVVLFRRPRFKFVTGTSPYVTMFDRETSQECWSRSKDPYDASGDNEAPPRASYYQLDSDWTVEKIPSCRVLRSLNPEK
jgi:hypothetical protein